MKTLSVLFLLLPGSQILAQNTNPWSSSGAVGIGTSSPQSPLHVVGASNSGAALKLTDVTNVGLEIRSTGNTIQYIDFVPYSTDDSGYGTPDMAGRIMYNALPHGMQFYTGGGSARMSITGSGDVGIGITDPTYSTLVGSKFTIAQSDGGTALAIGNGTTPRFALNPSSDGSWTMFDFAASSWTAGITQKAGNVGIGTPTPVEKLSVNGKIRSKEVKVEVTGWPDYVFEPAHKLPTLGELAAYIGANKHLPEIPSAAEVSTTGIELGEMNAKLLKKIEELTLYLIDQQKNMEQMAAQITELKRRVEKSEHHESEAAEKIPGN